MLKPKQTHFIVPQAVLVRTALILFALTFLTIFAFWEREHLGSFAAPVAFLIAAVKASQVMIYFMGLKYDSVMNRIIFALGFFFLALLFMICLLDVVTRTSVHSTL